MKKKGKRRKKRGRGEEGREGKADKGEEIICMFTKNLKGTFKLTF